MPTSIRHEIDDGAAGATVGLVEVRVDSFAPAAAVDSAKFDLAVPRERLDEFAADLIFAGGTDDQSLFEQPVWRALDVVAANPDLLT